MKNKESQGVICRPDFGCNSCRVFRAQRMFRRLFSTALPPKLLQMEGGLVDGSLYDERDRSGVGTAIQHQRPVHILIDPSLGALSSVNSPVTVHSTGTLVPGDFTVVLTGKRSRSPIRTARQRRSSMVTASAPL